VLEQIVGGYDAQLRALADAEVLLELAEEASDEASAKEVEQVVNLDLQVREELVQRVMAGQYVFPIQATYGMRMMTPARKVHFEKQNCEPTPEGL